MTESNDYYDSGISPRQNTVLKVAVVFEILAILVIITNIPRYIEERKFIFIGVFVLSFVIMVIWLIAFLGAIYGSYILIMMVWVSWIFFTFIWFFFITGCITPTRGPEGLWLVENKHRLEHEAEVEIDYYYHTYHSPLPDWLPRSLNNMMEHSLEYEEIRYEVTYMPMFTIPKFYRPWDSIMGAMIYLSTLLSALIFFVWSMIVLKNYANVLNDLRLKKTTYCGKKANCSC